MHLILAAMLVASAGFDVGGNAPRCEEMTRLSAAANREGSFRSLVEQGFAPRVLSHGCNPVGSGGYMCSQNLTPAEATPESYGAIIRDCLPGATMGIEAQRSWPATEHVVRHGRFVAELDENCTATCRAGRIMIVHFRVDPEQPPLD